MPNPSPSIPKATLFSLSLVLCLDGLVMGLVFPLMGGLFIEPTHAIVPFHTSLFVRDLWYSTAMASFFIFAIIGAPLLGDLSDKLGRRKVLLLSLSVNGISCLLCAMAIDLKIPLLLIAARALAGLSAGNQPLAQAAIIDKSTFETKTRNLSLISLAASLGFIIGPLLGGLLANPQKGLSYALPFEIAAIFVFINAMALLMTFRETFYPRQKSLNLLRGFGLLIDGFRHVKLKFWLYLFLIEQLAWGIYFQSLSLIFIEIHHYTTRQIGLLIMTLSLSFALSLAVIIPWALKRFQLANLLKIAFIGITLTMLIGAFSVHYSWSAWFTVISVGLSQAMIFTGCLTKISDSVDSQQQGWAMGVGTAVGSLAWGIAALCIGLLTHINVHLPFLTSAILFIFCGLALFKNKT